MPTRIARDRAESLQARKNREAELRKWFMQLSRADRNMLVGIAFEEVLVLIDPTERPFHG